MNNPEEWRPTWDSSSMSYLVWEMETGELGTPHIQGYCRFKQRKRMQQVAEIFPRAHLSLCRGSEEENRNYCLKEFTANPQVEHGEFGDYEPKQKQGRRKDLEEACNILKEGGLKRVAEEKPVEYVKYHQGFKALRTALQKPPPLMRDISTTILWGPPGTGKSHRAVTQFPEAYKVNPGRDPFGDYEEEDVIIFDEFDYEKWPVEQMNLLIDKYRLKLDCRYANKWAYWTTVIIISNIDPHNWWQYHNQVKKEAFLRRIDAIYEVTSIEETIPIRTQLVI